MGRDEKPSRLAVLAPAYGLLLFVPSAPTVRIVATLVTPRFPAQASDAERDRWLKRDRRVELALWTGSA